MLARGGACDIGRDIDHRRQQRILVLAPPDHEQFDRRGRAQLQRLSFTSASFRFAAAAGTIETPSPARTIARMEWIWPTCWT